MMKLNLKTLFIIFVAILIIVCLGSNDAFAANAIILNTNTSTDANTTTNTEPTTIAPTTTTTNTTSVSSYNNTTSTLPKTGENDIYVVSALILVCGVSAIYAYKKIRDYNM